MPTPYDYTVAQPNVGSYFDAVRQGREDRLATEKDTRNNALAKYLPQALQGDPGAQQQALASGSPDQMIQLKQVFQGMDEQKLATLRRNQSEVASLAVAATTPEAWAAVNARAKELDPNAQEIPFEQRAMVIAKAQTVAEALKAAHDEKLLANDTSRTTAQNAASYASAAASRAMAAQRGAGGAGRPLTATDKSAILDADQQVLGNKTAINLLLKAKTLSSKAYGGWGAGTLGTVTAQFGDTAGEATIEFDNMLQQQVLPQLKAIFGGQPTEGERKILLDLQGSSKLTHPVRARILDTAIGLARTRLNFNKEKAAELRSGDYFKTSPSSVSDDGGLSSKDGAAPVVSTQEEYDALPSGTIYIEPDGKEYRKP